MEDGDAHKVGAAGNGASHTRKSADALNKSHEWAPLLVDLARCCRVIGLPGRVALGALLAIAFGLLLRHEGPTDPTFVKALKMPGQLWLNLLKMTVVPLVFSCVVTSIFSIKRMVGGSRIGVAVMVYYTATTLLAAVEGLLVSAIILVPNVDPIEESTLPAVVASEYSKREKLTASRDVWDQFQAILEGFTPTNIISSAASGDLLGIISFSIMLALALPYNGGSVLVQLLTELNTAMFSIIGVLIVFTPLGVFSLVVEKVIQLEIAEILKYIGIFLGTVFTGLAFHNLVTYPIIFFALTRNNPFKYMSRMFPAMLTALGTSSSASTLPVTIQCAIDNGVPTDLAKFVLSLGATINMDGTAIGFPVAVFFLSYAQGIKFTVGRAVAVAILATLSSMGAAPIPSSGLVLLITILEAVDVPVNQLFGLIIAVDWIYDRPETMTNVVGDLFAAGIMTHWFGTNVVAPQEEEPMPSAQAFSEMAQKIKQIEHKLDGMGIDLFIECKE